MNVSDAPAAVSGRCRIRLSPKIPVRIGPPERRGQVRNLSARLARAAGRGSRLCAPMASGGRREILASVPPRLKSADLRFRCASAEGPAKMHVTEEGIEATGSLGWTRGVVRIAGVALRRSPSAVRA